MEENNIENNVVTEDQEPAPEQQENGSAEADVQQQDAVQTENTEEREAESQMTVGSDGEPEKAETQEQAQGTVDAETAGDGQEAETEDAGDSRESENGNFARETAARFASAVSGENAEMAKGLLKSVWELAQIAVKKPIEAVNNVLFRGKEKEGLLLGLCNLLLIFITTSLHFPVGSSSDYFTAGVRLYSAFIIAALIAAWILILAAAGYNFRRKDVKKLTYRKVLGAFCCITVPATFMSLVVFLVGFFSSTLAAVCIGLAYLATFCFSLILTYLIVDGDPDTKAWKTAGIFLAVNMIMGIVAILLLAGSLVAVVGTFVGMSAHGF